MFPVSLFCGRQCTDMHEIKQSCVESECGRAGIQVGQTVFCQSWQLLVVMSHYCTTLSRSHRDSTHLSASVLTLCLTHSTHVYNYAAFLEILWIYSSDPINTFTAIVDLSPFNNSCLKSPASTLVDLTFQSRALRSFSLNQLRNLSL